MLVTVLLIVVIFQGYRLLRSLKIYIRHRILLAESLNRSPVIMATKGAKKKTLKRKEALEDEVAEGDEFGDSLASLEMFTDEEGDDDASSDDG